MDGASAGPLEGALVLSADSQEPEGGARPGLGSSRAENGSEAGAGGLEGVGSAQAGGSGNLEHLLFQVLEEKRLLRTPRGRGQAKLSNGRRQARKLISVASSSSDSRTGVEQGC